MQSFDLKKYAIHIASFTIGLIFLKGFEYVNVGYYLLVPILIATMAYTLFPKEVAIIKWQIVIYLLPFIVWMFISSLWSINPSITIKRSLYFLFLVVGMEALSHLLPRGFNSLAKAFYVPVLLLIATSITSLLFMFPSDYWSGGNGLGLKGFSLHQNTLGSIILFCLPILNYMFIASIKESKKLFNLSLTVIVNIAAFFTLLVTFSRASILAYILFLLITGVLQIGWKKSFTYLSVAIISLFLLSYIPQVNKYINYAVNKNAPSLFTSRHELYKISINAAQEGKLTGVGYGMSNLNYTDNGYTRLQDGVYIREKGSSIFALAEEVGIVGLVLFYLPLIFMFYKWGIKNLFIPPKTPGEDLYNDIINEKKLLIAILIAMTFQSQFEAWATGVGSVSLPIYLFFWARLTNE